MEEQNEQKDEPIKIVNQPHNFIISRFGLDTFLFQFRPEAIINELKSHFALKYLEHKGHQIPGIYILRSESPFYSLLNFSEFAFLRYPKKAEEKLGQSRIPKIIDVMELQAELLDIEAKKVSENQVSLQSLLKEISDPHSVSVIGSCVKEAYDYYLKTLPEEIGMMADELLFESVAHTLSKIQKDAGLETEAADKFMINQLTKARKLALNERWNTRRPGVTPAHNKSELQTRYKELLDQYKAAKKYHDKKSEEYFRLSYTKNQTASRQEWRETWINLCKKEYPNLDSDLLALFAYYDDADIEPYPSVLAKHHLAKEKNVGIAYVSKLLKASPALRLKPRLNQKS
jgi:hypothetical protein